MYPICDGSMTGCPEKAMVHGPLPPPGQTALAMKWLFVLLGFGTVLNVAT